MDRNFLNLFLLWNVLYFSFVCGIIVSAGICGLSELEECPSKLPGFSIEKSGVILMDFPLHLSWNFSLAVFTMTNLFCTFVLLFWLSCHGLWPIYQCHAYEEVWFFLPYQPSTVYSSSTLTVSLCTPPPPMLDLLSDLILPGSYASKGICCELMSAEDSVSPRSCWLPSLIVFLPLPWHSLSIEWWRDCDINVTFRAEFFADTLLFDQCIDPSLPYKDSSLMRIESHSSLWVQR